MSPRQRARFSAPITAFIASAPRPSRTSPLAMASHVPFLAVRPDAQFSTKSRDFASTNGALTTDADAPESAIMPTIHAPKLPAPVAFTLTLLLSLTISVFLYSLIADTAGYELASVSRDLTAQWQVGIIFGWKVASLAAAWASGYDWLDLTALTLLSNTPYYHLLHTFYLLSPTAVLSALSIDLASIALPFFLFRRPASSTTAAELKPSSRAVVHDPSVLLLVTLFGSAIYATTLFASFNTWLPVYMIQYFDKILSLGRVRESNLFLLSVLALPLGAASTQFVFVPAVLASNRLLKALDPITAPVKFDPKTATLAQTVAWNLGLGPEGFSARTRVLIKRTGVLVLASSVNTTLRVLGTVEGTEVAGVLGWASVWGLAAGMTGVLYGWVAEE
ncbi:hypothetical protein B0A48_13524 [Cryoendolithus antarcticus]|uniref:Uncharacterized protein n=1 Tax=Cryoendolithus antarcticus TaxID=1507870 RepID=A0A1V8SNT6_9PEZI|nr:hypothetical protein B0A48_13524 [Cryoendolithus antarcticus]